MAWHTGWIVAADPGIHTGLVCTDPDDRVVARTTATSEEEIIRFLLSAYTARSICAIESFAGAGALIA
jgi:hypothetical protein